jgi:hypothetical protein
LKDAAMLLKKISICAACLIAASLLSPVFADDVPPPPPAGVTEVRVPSASPAAEPTPATEGVSLPQLPENPIKLESGKRSESNVVEAPAVAPPPVAAPVAAPVVRPPVQVVGPVYYFAPGPYTYPGNLMVPPPMHVPNSPFVEDLSVAGEHGRYPYYSYRRPWYTPGQMNRNVTIVW